MTPTPDVTRGPAPDYDPIYDVPDGMPRLLALMARLRDPEKGCPWDIEQDFDSIVPYTIEEAYEVADAIARRAWDEVPGELGDLLLQVVYFAQMGDEAGRFDFDAVARSVTAKMISRHPHVFGSDSRDKTAAAQVGDWERVKAGERADRGEGGALDGVALGLPALTRALKLQKRAARVGFDWPDPGGAAEKLAEEAAEFAEAARTGDPDAIEDELGDVLFSTVNLARHMGQDPEAALRRANEKFAHRFAQVEARLAAEGRSPRDATLEEMEAHWQAAKAAARDERA
ncbi:nucleoside triphosphate pyrophosphohydrolase [Mesobaculum littorinae]|uniref:Nucleoside triphosphate pyrophosphohydrolase n=1 Tax=Mesobaculum littorinae TaxID=2486419 RepID=A0A438AKX5_9RHOB|nr:nucleoside triphosphate pyrophosphohydrolase [Mesobaculum littorinae]RVV99320.1 nucleoside triphosphate pyrophosphohydrolase [Mesobaculum littorinae]